MDEFIFVELRNMMCYCTQKRHGSNPMPFVNYEIDLLNLIKKVIQ
jgi:hypothetical protein